MTENEHSSTGGPEPQQPIWAGTAPVHPHQGSSWYSASAPPSSTGPLPAVRPSNAGAGRVVAAAMLGFALAAGGGVVGGLVVHQVDEAHTPSASSASNNTPTSVKVIDRSSLADIAAMVKPSVVSIQVPGGEGSGVVFNSAGYIVTNNHVVAAARGNTVQVIFSDGTSVSAR